MYCALARRSIDGAIVGNGGLLSTCIFIISARLCIPARTMMWMLREREKVALLPGREDYLNVRHTL